MESLTLEEYKALGEAIKQANKNLKLIQKFLLIKNINYISASTGDFLDAICNVCCDLSNLSNTLEDKMDEDYYGEIANTIDFFN